MKTGIINSVDTAHARREVCPKCGATILRAEDDESFSCERCLFNLGLEELESSDKLLQTASGDFGSPCGTAGPYNLIEEIGRGGMGVIYRAHKSGERAMFAVKMLLPTPHDRSEALARFAREAEAVAALEHPGIMPIHEVCLEGDSPFFSMELAVGGSLADLLPKYRGRWHQAARLMVKVARAVQCAHDHGILHRDLKPGNILFTGDFEPLVSDFGLAKWLDGSSGDLTQSLVVFGTPNYVAPEQAEGKNRNLTAAADIYSLGAIFFELLTGRPPFVGDNPLDVLQQVLRGRVPGVRSICPAVPQSLEAICHRCLRNESHQRYDSAQALADDIERWLDGKRVTARSLGNLRFLSNHLAIRPLAEAVAAVAIIAVAIAFYPATAHQATKGPHGINALVDAPAIFTVDLSQGFTLAPAEAALGQALGTSFGRFSPTASLFPREQGEMPLNSTMVVDPLEVTRRINVGTALFESLRVTESHLRVVSRLIDCKEQKTIWVQTDNLPLQPADEDYQQLATTLKQRIARHSMLPSINHEIFETNNRTEVLCQKADEFYAHRNSIDNENAIKLYQQALRIAPDYVEAQAGLSKAYGASFHRWGKDKQRLDLAREAALHAITKDPFSAKAHSALADYYYASGQYIKAKEEYAAVLEADPHAASAYARLGMCLRELGKPSDGLAWMLRANQIDQMHGIFYTILAETYMLMADDEKAEQCFQQSYEFDPDQPDGSASRIVLHLWQSDWAQAEKMCSEFTARFPEYSFAKVLASEVALFSGDSSKALTLYQELAAKQAYTWEWEYFGAVSPHSAIAYLQLQSGEPSKAARNLDEAQQIDEHLLSERPRNPRLLHDLAAVWILKGDRRRSLEYLSAALSNGWVEHRSTLLDPRFAALHKDPQFEELLACSSPIRVGANLRH